ncbi:MAG: nucleoside recognition domain-containing protein [Chitinophagaceae bacterium]|jgi:spore maturation protein SpmA
MTLNYIWIAFFLIGFLVATYKAIFLGQADMFGTMLNNLFDSSKTGFEISIGLTGVMSLWLGIMKIGERAGLINIFAKGVAPFFRTLFKGVPKDHPAYGSMTMNFSANMLGLDNAATPLGLNAMKDLQSINPNKDTASDAQIMFLVLNTAGVTLIPTSVIAMRQSLAIKEGLTNFNAADIFLPTLIATFVAFITGMIMVSIFQKINLFKLPVLLFIGGFAALIIGIYFMVSHLPPDEMSRRIGSIGSGFIMFIVILFITAGAVRKQNVYDNFIEGAKEGFTTAIRIVPYLIAMLLAISVFRTSGCMDYIVNGIATIVAACGMNTDFVPTIPIGLMKPLSGSGARGLMVDVITKYGVDSFQGKLAAVLQGTTETTFYVLAVYFGSVDIKNSRHALICGLVADLAGFTAAILIAYAFFH